MVHDLHVWAITSEVPAMSCHIILKTGEDADAALSELSRLMSEKYAIAHTTIQIEFENWTARDTLPHCS
jgi:cobalt-zinc-cadmium efflux system protein